jgi:hypothetical protein
MRRSFFLATAAVAALFASAAARGDVLYDTTAGAQYTNVFGPAPMLDDVTVAAGPVTITGMNFGFRNTGATPEDVDAIVTVWDNMNTAATGSTVVNSTSLGSFRRPIGSILASGTGTTGLFNLATPINVPDATFGVSIEFVMAGTNDPSDVDALLSKNLPSPGTTSDKFWSDDGDGVFRGSDVVNFNPSNPTTHANFYLRVDGIVPEPASAAVAAVGLALAAARRGRNR